MTPADPAPSAGDTREFERVTLPFLPDVTRYARSLTGDREHAGDLVQETYLRAFRARHTFIPGSDARRWLFAICRHEFLRVRRREERIVDVGDEPALEALAAVGLHVAARRDGFDHLFTSIDLGPALARALQSLPEIHRTVVALVDIEGLDYGEAAEALGVPIGTVRSRLFRARRVLQEALIEYARDAGLVPRRQSPQSPAATGEDATR